MTAAAGNAKPQAVALLQGVLDGKAGATVGGISGDTAEKAFSSDCKRGNMTNNFNVMGIVIGLGQT